MAARGCVENRRAESTRDAQADTAASCSLIGSRPQSARHPPHSPILFPTHLWVELIFRGGSMFYQGFALPQRSRVQAGGWARDGSSAGFPYPRHTCAGPGRAGFGCGGADTVTRHARVGGVLTGGCGGRNVSIRTPKVRKAAVLSGLTWDHLLVKSTCCSCFKSVCVGLGLQASLLLFLVGRVAWF